MKPYTYFLILFFTVVICFIASFHRRIRFHKHFGTFLLSASIVAIPFIIWDVWFTREGVWWFDFSYTSGLAFAGLPVEEWLFFYCIPFACVFTYFCLEKFFNLGPAAAFNNVIAFTGFIVCIMAILLYHGNIYTFVTAVATLITLLFLHFVAKKDWLSAATFTYLILMPGFFTVNGVLTGSGIESPIVNYDNDEITGNRILTIPVEDAVYGYCLFLLNIYFFKLIRERKIEKSLLYEQGKSSAG
ncbi:MAG: lycopene cyclase domain-containing protein [Chitinophagaceae bacterium]|nr:MAG: lycopene cyclase domain-containing protein [Chitinophagaceae bacterium]